MKKYVSPPEYSSWGNMLSRCRNPNLPQYKNYGGRGIKVHPAWQSSFAAFLADVGSRPGPGYTLERLDNDKDYEPGNVRWATRKEQANNTRRCKWYDWQGGRYNVAQLAEMIGVPRYTMWKRLFRLGWPLERAMEPVQAAR